MELKTKILSMCRMPVIAVLLAAASCTGGSPAETGAGYGLVIEPQIDLIVPAQSQTEPASRAIVAGTAFPNGNEVGYVVLGSAYAYKNAGKPHLAGYGNVRAQSTGTAWLYYVDNTRYIGASLPGYPSYGKVDIYGYHPYRADMADLHDIPFSLLGSLSGEELTTSAEMTEKDYMYAEPLLNYPMPIGQSANMRFRHVMTCLEFRIRKMFAGPTLTLTSIEFTIEGNDRKFTVKGAFDAADGSLRHDLYAERITVEYNKSIGNSTVGSTSSYISAALILPALECSGAGDDATITAKLLFKDQEPDPDDPESEGWTFRDGDDSKYSFKLSDVGDAQGNKGLLTGKRYQVIVDVSNFVKYHGLPSIEYPDWERDKEDIAPSVI